MSIGESSVVNTAIDLGRQQTASVSGQTIKNQPEPAPAMPKPVKVDLPASEQDRLKNLKAALDQINQQMINSNQHLGFELNEHIKGPVITVQNTQTGEVIRKIPSEEVLRVAQSIDSLKGVIFNQNM
jgi:flagellar protein FlaG